MIKGVSGLILSGWIIAFSGCGPSKPGPETRHLCSPTNLKLDINDQRLTVSWEAPCDLTISGYNIYLSGQPLFTGKFTRDSHTGIQPFNRTVFPGDTEPDDGVEHFEAEFLDNGTDYYVSVCTVFPDGSLSLPSNEVHTVCGPRGEIELSVRYKGEHDGFSFDSSRFVSADASSNDIYFFSKDGVDYVCSPVRLNGFLKDNRLEKTSPGESFDEVYFILRNASDTPSETRVPVSRGDWVWLRGNDQSNTLLKVVGFNGKGSNRRITLEYAYFPVLGQP